MAKTKPQRIKVEDVKTWEEDFLGFLHHKYQGVLDGIRETGKLDEMCYRLADFFDAEMTRGLELIGKLVEPGGD